MIYCFDTFYGDGYAKTAAVGINNWDSSKPKVELSDTIYKVNKYESGAFYKRELPCLLHLLSKVNLNHAEDILVIDGYVLLSDDGKLGLGGYLYNALDNKVPVIGVAKSNFSTIYELKEKIYRGSSKKPLFVTSLGYDLQKASKNILSMHGNYRIPTILKLADQNSRA